MRIVFRKIVRNDCMEKPVRRKGEKEWNLQRNWSVLRKDSAGR